MNKKGFLLYTDQKEIFETLTPEQCKELVLAIFNYPEERELSPIVKIAFIPIKNQLKRDMEKWEEKTKKRSDAGKKGMEKRWKKLKNRDKITNDNNVINGYQPITKITVNDNVNVNDNDININKYISKEKHKTYTTENLTIEQVSKRLEKLFNDATGKKSKIPPNVLKNLAYWLETYEPNDIARAIRQIPKDDYWGVGGKAEGAMTPTILFRKKNTAGEDVDYIGNLLNSKKEDSWTK